METKPGVQTTEFWVTIFGSILNVANLAGVWDFTSNRYSVIAIAVINALYSVSRGQAKQGVAYNPAEEARLKAQAR